MLAVSEPHKEIVGGGSNAKHINECTELHLGSRGIQRLHGFEHFVNLESLWLNNNRLQALNHLDANFRIRELYVHDNSICTLKGSLRCFKFLSVLDLSNNRLCNLQKVAAMLATFMFLQSLNLSGNPCCQEVHYRLVLIHAIPSLVVLDLHMVKKRERDEACSKAGGNMGTNRIAFCRSKPAFDAACSKLTSEQSYHERLLHVKSKKAAARRAAEIAAEEAHCKAFTPYPTTNVVRRPLAPGWKAEWPVTQMLVGSAATRGAREGLLPLLLQRVPVGKGFPLHDIAKMQLPEVLQHSTYRSKDVYSNFVCGPPSPSTVSPPEPSATSTARGLIQFDHEGYRFLLHRKEEEGPWVVWQERSTF